jgi:hypothetical protein
VETTAFTQDRQRGFVALTSSAARLEGRQAGTATAGKDRAAGKPPAERAMAQTAKPSGKPGTATLGKARTASKPVGKAASAQSATPAVPAAGSRKPPLKRR